ncbi:MAG: pectinesterase family protein [Paraglaciecola sp.]|uniref:pectinesterase family protein n=1 Tax=Paraglaciecola sp. TaxID=1920173 RepID=UPI00273FF012|nr:pectinesterase family protein [Paraglaciecola sp.]MDP5029353.1 pectinesterase family protein [Paraglaciecola sp.]MDP5133468.1 pectinesterase family protein [Paraglaciecola sp.]
MSTYHNRSRIKIFSFVLLFGLSICHFHIGATTLDESDPEIKAIVDPSNPEAFKTITEALSAAPNNLTLPYTIKIMAGDYYEKVEISKPFIRLVGESATTTRLYFDAYAGLKTSSGQTLGTSKSATLTINAPNFSAENLHIENTFDYPYYDGLAQDNPSRLNGLQAVAVLTNQGSDKAFFKNVNISGYQDTLYLKSGRSFFLNTTISGHIDFIFGGGTAVFYRSNIVTRFRPNQPYPIGYVTAPSTPIEQKFGLVFIDSSLKKEAGVEKNSMALGRPWHPTTSFEDGRYADPRAIGQTVFINTFMDDHIQQDPWHPMHGKSKTGEMIMFSPLEARFFEYASYGPGANPSKTRRQLTSAAAFSVSNILAGWQPPIDNQLYSGHVDTREVIDHLVGEIADFTIETEFVKNVSNYPFITPINQTSTNNLDDSVISHLNVVYKTVQGIDLYLDVFSPKTIAKPVPAVVMVHGGAWRSGDKSHQVPTARWLAEHGYVGVAVGYRLSKQALYPAGLEDINGAIIWLKQHHQRYSVDPNRIAILGASSGAHMATLLGTMGTDPNSDSPYEAVNAIINIDGVADLASPQAREFEDKPNKISYAALWLGGHYVQEPRLWHQASPIEYVGRYTPPTLFINSSYDRFHIGRPAYVETLSQYGIYSEIHTIPDTPHPFWLFHPWADTTRDILLNFLNKVFAPPLSEVDKLLMPCAQACVEGEAFNGAQQ